MVSARCRADAASRALLGGVCRRARRHEDSCRVLGGSRSGHCGGADQAGSVVQRPPHRRTLASPTSPSSEDVLVMRQPPAIAPRIPEGCASSSGTRRRQKRPPTRRPAGRFSRPSPSAPETVVDASDAPRTQGLRSAVLARARARARGTPQQCDQWPRAHTLEMCRRGISRVATPIREMACGRPELGQ